ncbi:hypothetical protein KDK_28730 [Dictyobacter kobayashii]|uniref:Amidase domain-containing protein n=1 Tax=Dictyobacter kobayashii TaxID=2014872 RepID=A0A402AJ32_9CHLR|nr:hypothetical protein KDK_28730 [Dictyobacter kobayashii]
MDLYRTIQKPEATLAHTQKGWYPAHSELYSELVRTRLQEGERIPAVAYLNAQQERRIFASSLRSLMQRVDALVLPTIPTPAIPLELAGKTIEIDGQSEDATTAYLRITMPFSLAGLPTVAFPAGFSAAGLPIGLQVVGRPFEEATVLRIVNAYQQMTDWHQRQLPSAINKDI